jgi:hypothetical protein
MPCWNWNIGGQVQALHAHCDMEIRPPLIESSKLIFCTLAACRSNSDMTRRYGKCCVCRKMAGESCNADVQRQGLD